MTLPAADLAALASSHDIIQLGILADEVRRERHGTRTTFVRVFTVPAEPGAPVVVPEGAGEVCIVGVAASRASAVARIREVRLASGATPVSAFSLADLEALSAREGMTLRTLLEELAAAGLELIAEAPVDRLQDPRRSIEEVNIAGLALARLTLQQKPASDPMPLLMQVASLQYDVAVIRAFAPLPRAVNPAVPTTGYEDVKAVALARLIVTNVPSIQVDWSLYGPKLAQVALTMGADDVDSVSALNDETEGRRRTALAIVKSNIIAAGFEPVERNGRFEPIPR
jgi:aminodeoxyfutalosine synthase